MPLPTPPRTAAVLLLAFAALLLPGCGSARAQGTSWGWPLAGRHDVLRGYAPPAHDWLRGHRGVDLAAAPGADVLAAGAGTVTVAGMVAGTAVVAVRHADGLETTYQPLAPVLRVGTRVRTGTVLGHLLAADGHCGPQACLHWGLRRGTSYLDPLLLVGAARVRLLPLLGSTTTPPWVVPAAAGASVGSSAMVAGWALVTGRRRRRRPPPGVTSLCEARRRRATPGPRAS